jgi:acetyl-CoA synthetase
MDVRPGSSGRPLPGVEVAVLDGEYAPVPTGIEGALALRPGWPSMFRACWNDSELYNASFRKGWYIPGQQARIDNDGYVWLADC